MSLEVALYLMRQTQIVNMQVGHDPVLGGILASLETLARENVTEQRTALDWLESNHEHLFPVE
jgi:hypothetical protein